MNRFKFFGSRPVFYLDAPAAGGGGTASGGGAPAGGSGAGSGAGAASGGGTSAAVSDEEFLSAPEPAAAPDAKAAEAEAAKKAAEAAESEEINLSVLEEGQPEWLAKVTDEAAKTEIGKLLAFQKKVTDRFKDEAGLDNFWKDLPGGVEQVAAMQLLTKEVGEIDRHIAANTPEGNGIVVERYLGEAPDGGVGLFRAGAQHLANTHPEQWQELGTELTNASLKASGLGVDLQTLVGAVAEMRAAIQKDDGEAFGNAAAKLLGQPKPDAKPDPNAAKAADTAKADAERVKAQSESWQFRNDKSIDKIVNHLSTETGKLLSKVLPASIGEKDRAGLRQDIGAEILSQLNANAFLTSKVVQLIGFPTKNAKGEADYGKANLRASQADFDKATELCLSAATPKLIAAAVSKVVSKWSKDRAASNKEARDKAKSAATKVDVGAGKTPASNGRGKPLTEEQFRQMDDIQFLNYGFEK